MSRKDAIGNALASVYSSTGTYTEKDMIGACAKHLDDTWNTMVSQAQEWADRGSDRDLEREVMLQIWNWFPGGGTAEIAAKRVMEAVDGI